MTPASITSLDTWRGRRPGASGGVRVADVAETALARIPLWFTAAQAGGIAKLKGVRHLLVEDRGQVAGSVSTDVLRQARGTDAVARWMSRSQAHVTPDLSLEEAERRLRQEGVSCLPVVSSGLLVGTVSLEDILVDLPHAA
jgi:CBS domain-containing protein